MSVVPPSSSRCRPSTTRPCLTALEREVGMAHLSHMERLARIRLSSSKGIQDAADVDFAKEHSKEALGRSEPLGGSSSRYMRLLKANEKVLYKKNQIILNNLIETTDSVRRAQQMYRSPEEENVLCRLKAEQARRRMFQRRRDAESVQHANQIVLRHLIEVKPNVLTTKSLNEWYRNVHTKRVAKISRFKPAEPFAGARILESECGVRLGSSYPHETDKLDQDYQTKQGPWEADPTCLVRMPLLRGHPFPPPSIGELMRTVPRALLPPLMSTSYDGFIINENPNIPVAEAVEWAASGRSGRVRSPSSRSPARRVRHPPWQNLSASDIPMFHYVQDAADRGEASRPLVHPLEEGGCTRLWRRAVRRGTASSKPKPAAPDGIQGGGGGGGRRSFLESRGETQPDRVRVRRLRGSPGMTASGLTEAPADGGEGATAAAAPPSKTSHLADWAAETPALSGGSYPAEHEGSPQPISTPPHKAGMRYDTQRNELWVNEKETASTELPQQPAEDFSSDIPYYALLNEWSDASKRGVGRAFIAL
ncbi:unnamed protein product [Phytomonas sp. EM1]|nr:unnamed protein product [Phytomonas sp. EM1]|eukprot:CCW65337.1 unnamed protein product [Phytomonas sp. isolate EM1]